ncbi:MAG TPA: phosphoglycerate kinase [Candidatus Paceibacterota bacterium]|nr:phosphoglycerate kinase [Candidatus Paceibacterota bacterium]HPT18060.1 phosphoglycerate kinase [Candidatus Paceibacterota bacterium]
MKSIKNLKNIKDKKILVRVDFNVPIKNKKVLDDFRIKKALPTIKFLQKKGAKVILISHLGKEGTESMKPVALCLKKYIKKNITLLENIRKYPGEEKNDPKFAKELAETGDIYVNEAFSVSHREHASVVGIPKYLPSYAGFQFEEEVKNLSNVVKNSKHPFLFILGGAKFSTKIPLIKKYIKLADYVFVGGAILNDFLKAKGYEIGKSLVDNSDYDISSILKDKKLILPVDVIVKSGNILVNKKIEEVDKNEIILDIGKESIKLVEEYIKKSKLILWNGPLGKYEDGGDVGTKKILKAIANSKAESIIGGGDIVSVISKLKLEKKFSFVSTGGGATLDYLANGTLPGIKALE